MLGPLLFVVLIRDSDPVLATTFASSFTDETRIGGYITFGHKSQHTVTMHYDYKKILAGYNSGLKTQHESECFQV